MSQLPSIGFSAASYIAFKYQAELNLLSPCERDEWNRNKTTEIATRIQELKELKLSFACDYTTLLSGDSLKESEVQTIQASGGVILPPLAAAVQLVSCPRIVPSHGTFDRLQMAGSHSRYHQVLTENPMMKADHLTELRDVVTLDPNSYEEQQPLLDNLGDIPALLYRFFREYQSYEDFASELLKGLEEVETGVWLYDLVTVVDEEHLHDCMEANSRANASRTASE